MELARPLCIDGRSHACRAVRALAQAARLGVPRAPRNGARRGVASGTVRRHYVAMWSTIVRVKGGSCVLYHSCSSHHAYAIRDA